MGCSEVSLAQSRLTTFTRPLNDRGVEAIERPTSEKGWLPHAEPALVVDTEGLPDGEFTED